MSFKFQRRCSMASHMLHIVLQWAYKVLLKALHVPPHGNENPGPVLLQGMSSSSRSDSDMKVVID